MSTWQLTDIEAAIGGDLYAYQRLIASSMHMVTGIALTIVKDIDDSEDVAQQVYITVWQKLGSLKNPASFLHWLRELTRNTAFNYLRDNKIQKRAAQEEAEAIFAGLLDEHPIPEKYLEREQQSVLLARLIDALPTDSREVVVLYYREEQSTAHVAVLLDLQEATVRQRLSRARVQLKDELLTRYGKVLAISVPSVGLSAAIAAGLSAANPAVASTSVFIAGEKISGIGKLMIMIGGAGIGALSGILGIFWGAEPGIRKASGQALRMQLKRLRNLAIGWLLFCSVLVFFVYEFTQGAVAPLLAYGLFMAGLIMITTRMTRLLKSQELQDQISANNRSPKFPLGMIASRAGFIIGGVMGIAGMLVGLLNSGRLTLPW